MKLRTIIFSVLLSSVLCKPVYSQEWIRVYGDDISAYPHSIIETYDKGYLYGGTIVQGEIPKYGWIFKTDINGEMLWDKKLGEYGDVTGILDIKQTIDNGYILSGSTKKLDPYYDPFVMKLNACGEKEWCKILHLPYNMDFGSRILQLPNGNYIALLSYFSYNFGERIWLMCFDEAGEILWKKVYAQNDPFINNENGHDLMVTSDSNILITGESDYPIFPDTNTVVYRNFLIKVDFSGQEKWALVWGTEQQFYGYARSSVDSKNGNIFTVGRHLTLNPNFGYSATLLKTNKHGEELTYHDLIDSTQFGFATTINWFADSSLAIGAFWDSIDVYNLGVIKVDTLGNITKTKVLKEISWTFMAGIKTFDNKLLLTTGFYIDNNWDIYSYKVNSDLEYDTIYTQPFVYDSLCPYPIVSDTIPLDCVVVGLEEERKVEERTQLSIIPNPAKDKIKVVLPEHIITHTKTAGFNVTTWRYQFNGEIQLEIYDLYGRMWHHQVVAKGDKEAEIPVSSLPTGLYVVRAVIDGKVVSGKFVKQ